MSARRTHYQEHPGFRYAIQINFLRIIKQHATLQLQEMGPFVPKSKLLFQLNLVSAQKDMKNPDFLII